MDDNDIILYDIDSANSAHFYIIDHIVVSNVHGHSANYSVMWLDYIGFIIHMPSKWCHIYNLMDHK